MNSSSSRRDFLRSALDATVVTSTLRVITPGRIRGLEFSAPIPARAPGVASGGHDRLQPDWYRNKIRQVQAGMAQRKLDALVLLNATNIIYTTGYFHISTERPLAALIPKSGDPALFIPDLESDQVKTWWVQDYESYFDYPGPENRVRWIFERVARRGLDHGRIGIEEPTPSRLKEIKKGAPHAKFVNSGDLVEQMRWVKDEDEIRVMRRAMYFADFSVAAGREFIRKNGSVTEDQILKATANALADKMSVELHDVEGVTIEAPFGGLLPFGKRSAFPHAVPSKDKLKSGDALILSFGSRVGGYTVECERAFSVGQPTEHAKRLYEAMLAAHDTAVAELKDGAVAQDVDQHALDQIRKAGFEQFLRHRTGHGIGLQGHESPWIAEGDMTVLREGMTFSCEPGVYDPDFGCFRHSDTIVVRKEKGEVLNTYPTRLSDMIIEI